VNNVYQRLLWLYPAEHRREFGGEMCSVFREVWADVAAGGVFARSACFAREFAGLLSGAAREHLRRLPVFEVGALLSTRRFNMRNGFRFPKTTAALMTIILLGVILAIRKGEAIAYSLPHVSEPVGPIHPVHSGLLSPIPLFFLAFYAAGVLGWAILFALRRSGVHRLDEMSGERK
jgi:hypothetical protein